MTIPMSSKICYASNAMPEPLNTTGSEQPTLHSVAPAQHHIFYGWWIAMGGMAILTITSGIGFFGHTLILDPLRTEFGWSKGTFSSAVTLFLLVSAIAGSFIGGIVDRYGPSPTMLGTGLWILDFIRISFPLSSISSVREPKIFLLNLSV